MEIKFTLPIMAELDGKLYEVDYIAMGQSRTSVYLKDDYKHYNSVDLKFYLWDREIDIYSSGACNPYLKVTAPLIKYKDEDNED